MYKKIVGVLLLSCFFFFVVSIAVVHADAISDATSNINSTFGDEIVKSDDFNALIGKAIGMALGIIGTVALVIFIYSGIIWMTSGGNEKRIKTAEHSMIWAALGLFIIFMSYILVSTIISKFGV